MTNVSLGQGYLSQGRLELAMQKLQRALELDPKLPAAHTVIAVLYDRIGDTQKARTHYLRATELAPTSGGVLNNYAVFLCHSRDFENADAYFARALADPFYETPAVGHANRGTCALDWGRLDVAEESLRRAVQLEPEMPDALYGMARVSVAKNDFLRARAFVQRYEATGKAGAEGLGLGYDIERKLGNMRGANEFRARLLREFPESEPARRLAGEGASK
jgi:type IV pilus assembly protein PilF